MMYLTGVTRPHYRSTLIGAGVGLLTQPGTYRQPEVDLWPAWAADNGCFADNFNEARWLAWLGALDPARCLFAVAPDVVGDAAATFARSTPWLGHLRSLGFPAAYVAQDGIEATPPPWGSFDVLFIGGTTEFKFSGPCYDAVCEARRRGIPVHMGRVNSFKRLAYAAFIGCDTADGTFLKFGPDANLPRLLGWLRRLDANPPLPPPALLPVPASEVEVLCSSVAAGVPVETVCLLLHAQGRPNIAALLLPYLVAAQPAVEVPFDLPLAA